MENFHLQLEQDGETVTGLTCAFVYYPYSGAELGSELRPHLPLWLRSRAPTHLALFVQPQYNHLVPTNTLCPDHGP